LLSDTSEPNSTDILLRINQNVWSVKG
jgi:hypothetical protein